MALKRKTTETYMTVKAVSAEFGIGRARVLQLLDEHSISGVAIVTGVKGQRSLGIAMADFQHLKKARLKPKPRGRAAKKLQGAVMPVPPPADFQTQLDELRLAFMDLHDLVDGVSRQITAKLHAEEASRANGHLAAHQLSDGAAAAGLDDPWGQDENLPLA